MAQIDYSLTKLLPEFERLLLWEITSPEGLSALFVALLITVGVFFSLLSLWNYWRASNHLKFYRTLLQNLEGLKPDQLLEKRREINNQALEHRSYGQLWGEFDESLVHIPQKQRLCNTLDAAHFFNTHTIARGLTENRLQAAVPGFLTAIGVIGTFAGLQLGLGPLGELDPATAEASDLTQSIFGMIGGASIAFMTSVWGVFTSVLFNFFEKFLERNIRASITSFQNDVDYLYPRITAEQSLANIEDFSRQSNDKLAELDEKIGHKMQEAMREASEVINDGMQQSLNTILGPAIEKLVDNAHSGSEKALETLLERFLEGVGSAGDAQKEMMQQAAEDIAAASGGMADGLSSFASRLDSQIDTMMEKNTKILSNVESSITSQLQSQQQQDAQRQQALNASMHKFMENSGEQMARLAQQNADTMQKVQGDLSNQVEQQQSREIARQKILHGQLQGFQGAQEKITRGIDQVLATQKQQNTEITSSLDSLVKRFEQLANSHELSTEAMQQVSSDLKGASNQLGILSVNVKEAADSLSSEMSNAVKQADNITQQNKHTAQLFGDLSAALNQTHIKLNETAQTMGGAAERAETGFSAVGQHFKTLGQSLEDHVKGLEDQVAHLLNEYADRVRSQTSDRMNTWNEQTNGYTSAMTNAIYTLNSVVDEIEGKVGARRESNAG